MKPIDGIIQSMEAEAIMIDGEYDVRAGRRLRRPKDYNKIQETMVAERYTVTVEIVIAADQPVPEWLTSKNIYGRVLSMSPKGVK